MDQVSFLGGPLLQLIAILNSNRGSVSTAVFCRTKNLLPNRLTIGVCRTFLISEVIGGGQSDR